MKQLFIFKKYSNIAGVSRIGEFFLSGNPSGSTRCSLRPIYVFTVLREMPVRRTIAYMEKSFLFNLSICFIWSIAISLPAISPFESFFYGAVQYGRSPQTRPSIMTVVRIME